MNQLKQQIKNLLQETSARNVILVRHGITQFNKDLVVYGHTDVPLSEDGINQATKLSQALPNFQYQSIYSSDLKRSLETARLALNLKEYNQLTDKRLRELNFGDHEQKPYSHFTDEQMQHILSDKYKAPNGESWIELRERAVQFFHEKLQKNGTYLIFTHGGLICTLTIPLGIKDAIPNCSMVALELDQKNSTPSKVKFYWKFS